MRFLYKLENRSATGRKHSGEKKTEISFEKKNILEKMFKLRVNDELLSMDESSAANEHSKRMKNLNNLIRHAIHNIMTAVKKGAHRKRVRDERVDTFASFKRARINEGMHNI